MNIVAYDEAGHIQGRIGQEVHPHSLVVERHRFQMVDSLSITVVQAHQR